MKPFLAVFAIIFCALILVFLINGALFIFIFKPFLYGNLRPITPQLQRAADSHIITNNPLTIPSDDNNYPTSINRSDTPKITLDYSGSVNKHLSSTFSPSLSATFLTTNTRIFTLTDSRTPTTKPSNTPKATKTAFSPTPKPTHTFTITPSITPLPFMGALLISEIMINPSGNQPQNEWIEISNPNDSAVDLTYFKIGDEETSLQSEGMYLFPEGTILLPKQVFVIANQAKAFQDVYGFLPNAEFENTHPQVPCMEPFTSWSKGTINLNNGGDEVIIMDGANHVLDAVSWGNSPKFTDLYHLGIKLGSSLERYPTFLVSFSSDSWRSQANPNPGYAALDPTPTSTVITLTPTPMFTSTSTFTPTKEYTSVPALQLFITEIYFPKLEEGPMYSWVKICNPNPLYASLDEMKLGDNLLLDYSEVEYEFPINSDLMPNHCIIIAYQAEKFRSLYHQNPDYELLDTDNTVNNLNLSIGYNNNFYLDPTDDELLLLDQGYVEVDGIGWGNSIYGNKVNYPVVLGTSIKREKNNLNNWIIDFDPIPTNLLDEQ